MFRAGISNYIHIKLWDIITHPCPNLNYLEEQLHPTETVEYNYFYVAYSQIIYVSKRGPENQMMWFVIVNMNCLYRDHSGYGLSQWEVTLHCNVISHWLRLYPECSLCTFYMIANCVVFHCCCWALCCIHLLWWKVFYAILFVKICMHPHPLLI